MRKTIMYFITAFVYTFGFQNAEDKFMDKDEAGFKYPYHNWDPSQILPDTPVNNFIVSHNGDVEDFEGTTLTAAAVWIDDTHTPANSFKVVDGKIEFDSGWCVSLLRDMAFMLNFTIQAINSSTYTTSVNGTLTGPGGLIVSGKADLAIGLQYFSIEKESALRPIHCLGIHRMNVFFQQPKVGGARNIYTQPFLNTTWIVIFVVIVSFVVSTLICCALEMKYFHENYELKDSITWICGIVLSQSFFDPGTFPMRIIFISALSTVLVVSNSYSAFLISSLANEYIPITTLNDIEKYKYKVIVEERHNYVCGKIFSSRRAQKKRCGFYNGEADAINKVYRDRREHYAFVKSLHLISVTLKSLHYANQEICTASSIPLPFRRPVTSMYALRNSPLISILNPKLLKLHERGINPRYSDIFDEETVVKCSGRKFTYDPDVEVADVYVAFCVLLFGVVISSSLFLFERLYLRLNKWKEHYDMRWVNHQHVTEKLTEEYKANYINWNAKTDYSYNKDN